MGATCVARSGQKMNQLGLSQRREEDRRWCPRESRITVASPPVPVNSDHGASSVQIRGGDEGTRTPDPLLAKEVLSQLSYIPTAGIVSVAAVPVKGALAEDHRAVTVQQHAIARDAIGPTWPVQRTRHRVPPVPARQRRAVAAGDRIYDSAPVGTGEREDELSGVHLLA